MSTAWVFAGHGSQYVGMGRHVLHQTEPGRAWLLAAERASGLALGRLALEGPARALTDPRVVEPLLTAVSGAWVDVLRAEEGLPDALAASSAGHVAALYAAGVVDRQNSLAIACLRGDILAQVAARIEGGMVAVHGLPDAQLVAIAAADADEPASIAAHNAPNYVVFSATEAALARAAARASHAGAVTAPLDVAGPWHSPLLNPAAVAIQTRLEEIPFLPPTMPIWSSVTAEPEDDPARLRWAVAASVRSTIEWHATVLAMLQSGIRSFVEVSPGRSLYALLGQLGPEHPVTRRYVECQRGPARRRRPLTRSPVHLTEQRSL